MVQPRPTLRHMEYCRNRNETLARSCRMCKDTHMESIKDFCNWAKTQRRAAQMLGVSEATVSRLVRGDIRVSPEIAERVEEVSGGLFRKERVLWPANSDSSL